VKLLKSDDLAQIAREERIKQGLTQEQVADRVALRTDTKSCTKQAVSQAENPKSGSTATEYSLIWRMLDLLGFPGLALYLILGKTAVMVLW